MQFNPIAFAENLSRVYEISRCGDHTIKVINPENSDGHYLTTKDLDLICGYFGIESHDDADMYIEVPKPEAAQMLMALANSGRYETIEDVNARIKAYSKHPFPEFDRTLGKAENLLKQAISKLDLDFNEIMKVLNVAETIAQMSGANKYSVEHIAEALQYQSVETHVRRNLNLNK